MKKTPSSVRYTVEIGPVEDLGTLRSSIQSLLKRTEAQRKRTAAEWITDPILLQRERRRLLSLLPYHPSPVPFRPQLLQEEQFENYTRKTYRLQINPDSTTEAFLYLPRGASKKNPAPALIALHEHGGNLLLGKMKLAKIAGMAPVFRKEQEALYGGQAPADYFAAHGFAVIAIDHLGFGGRALWRDNEPAYYRGNVPITTAKQWEIRLRMRHERFALHRALMACGVSEADIALYDDIRTVDFLETIPQIDKKRIGAFGLSVGCMHTHHLAAFDPRIKASARICWTGDFGVCMEAAGPKAFEPHFELPHIYAQYHIPELVALSYPNPVLILNGKKDPMYPFKAQEVARRQILHYSKLQGAPGRVRWVYFDGGHQFFPTQQKQALEFFQNSLKPAFS